MTDTVERIISNIDALLPNWRSHYPSDESMVHIPRQELLMLVEAARETATLRTQLAAAEERCVKAEGGIHLNEATLDAIESLCDRATPPPWVAHEMTHFGEPGTGFGWVTYEGGQLSPDRSSWNNALFGHGEADSGFLGDAQFVAAARTAIPELIVEVRTLRTQLAAAEARCVVLEKACGMQRFGGAP